MATYKEIKGVTVQTRDEDPVGNVGSWSSGGSLNTARGGMGRSWNFTNCCNKQLVDIQIQPNNTNNVALNNTMELLGQKLRIKHSKRSNASGSGTTTAVIAFGGDAPGSVVQSLKLGTVLLGLNLLI